MKYLIIAALLFASCKPGYNDVMTKLVNERKMINDSAPVLKERSDSLITAIVDKKGDSAICMRLAIMTGNKADSLRERLPAVLFSIDSLTKMK